MRARRRRLAGTDGLAVLLGIALCASLAHAGDYHTGATLICAQCHVADQTLPHDGTGGGWPPAAGGPDRPLLQQDVTLLCLSCHDGRSDAPDVYGLQSSDYVREAGSLPTGAAPHEKWKGHTLSSLACTDCHDPHGDAGGRPEGSQYRNLSIRPGGAFPDRVVTYAIGTNDLTKDVFERDARLGQIAVHYSEANVDFNRPDPRESAVSRWCSSCHRDRHGDSSSANMRVQSAPAGTCWLRHPAADAAVGALRDPQHSSRAVFNDTRKPNRVKVMSAAGAWSQPYLGSITPNCLTCHKAHGNGNPFGLIYMSGTGSITEEGDTHGKQLQDLCRQCHVQ